MPELTLVLGGLACVFHVLPTIFTHYKTSNNFKELRTVFMLWVFVCLPLVIVFALADTYYFEIVSINFNIEIRDHWAQVFTWWWGGSALLLMLIMYIGALADRRINND